MEHNFDQPLRCFDIEKDSPDEKVIALAGNPNVGKSTLFNELTGLKQHTGNWPGKTVTNAQGKHHFMGDTYLLVDLPGTYSLMAHSTEEEVARDFICFGNTDAVIVVCDATCLERNLNLVLQTIEITENVVVCINLMDEARKKHIKINLKKLEQDLGVPVVGTSARNKRGICELMTKVAELTDRVEPISPLRIHYNQSIEEAISILEPAIWELIGGRLNSRWISLKLLEYDKSLMQSLTNSLGYNILEDSLILKKWIEAKFHLKENHITDDILRDVVVSSLVMTAEGICADVLTYQNKSYDAIDRKMDRIFTSKKTGIPVMLLLLTGVLWLTITGANYPSQLISTFLFWIGDRIAASLLWIGTPLWLEQMLVDGIYKVLAWVVSVMFPPMAIFFPLFTLLEDFGYLPRVAFNLDHYFKKACACGKQALTMCMGFGCNAAGIVGCRIIDSPREQLIAIITNNFVPCNGRFPTLIAIISMFFVGGVVGGFASVFSSLLLTLVIILGVFMTFLISKLLSKTILKGLPSSFTLELPPYRKPQIGKVIVRSIFDRTLFILGRAVTVAIPAGLIIWIMANVMMGDMSLLTHCANFLNPFARLLGMDGYILLAFILAFPANEIVVPIIIMSYLSKGSILELDNLSALKELLISNGWTWLTAVNTMLFSLMHWPCSTTCLTIKKETQSLKWTAISFLVPTLTGILICFTLTTIVRLLGLE